ncbi:MAG: ABC transporter permease [bacterium]|nr:ABC transporter permease [bacterium]
MRNILAVAQNTFRETVRDRILYVIFVFAALMIIGSTLAGSISLDQDIKVMKDFGLASIFLFSILMAVFIGTNLVYKELDKRTIFLLLSKPVKRSDVIIGKFFGLAATMLVMILLMSIFYIGLIKYKTGQWDILSLQAIGFNYLEVLLMIGLTLMFSTFTAPISSAIYSLLLFLIGHSSSTIMHIVKTSTGFSKYLLEAAYYVFPNLEKFNIRNNVVYGIGASLEQTLLAIAYSAVYCIFLIYLGIAILKKQEF